MLYCCPATWVRSRSPAPAVSPRTSNATTHLATLLGCRQTRLPAVHLSAIRRLPRPTPSVATTRPAEARRGAKSTRRSAPAVTGTGNGTAPWSTPTRTGERHRFAPAPPPLARVAMVHPQRARHARAAWQNARLATMRTTKVARVVWLGEVHALPRNTSLKPRLAFKIAFALPRVVPARVA